MVKVDKLFYQSVQFELGNGNEVSIWHNHWTEDRPLKYNYLILFHLTSLPNLSVQQFKSLSDVNSIFRVETIMILEDALQDFRCCTENIILTEDPDKAKWK